MESENQHLKDVSDVVDTLISTMPEPQEHAIDNFQNEQKQKENEINKIPEQWRDLVDADGKHFDPLIHRTNKNGEPSLSKNGRLMRKGAGPAQPQRKSFVAGVDNQTGDATPSPSLSHVELGAVSADLVFTMGVLIGGEEWQPSVDQATGLNERENMVKAFANYYRATGQKDLPPNLALTMSIMFYVMPRLTKEKTQSRIKNAVTWVVAKWTAWRAKKRLISGAPA